MIIKMTGHKILQIIDLTTELFRLHQNVTNWAYLICAADKKPTSQLQML